MLTSLLQTKLYAPRARPLLVPRPRLIEKLNQGIHHKLTLLSAPAGFGKTTLVSEWIAAEAWPTAWLSLDESDTDPIRFLTYFVAAMQRIAPDVGQTILAGLQSPQPPPVASILTNLLNEIAAMPQAILFVLDDYHRVEAKAVDEALTFLLEHLPPTLHLVITTREDPQLPLPRLRARGLLTELRAADLRFTEAEAAVFLNEAMSLNLSPADVASLESRTEGWIAGLQLAALALKGHGSQPRPGERSQFIQAMAGDNRYILDYLVTEVLQHQPDPIRRFLLETSILNRLSGPLCDAVTGQANGSNLLETLERTNLFVISLDDKRRWYRYHHLFADMLQAHLKREQPDAVPELHRRASLWYEENKAPTDAIRHALAAPDFEQAAALIEMGWPALEKGFRPATWLGWVQALPDALVHTRPVLNLGCAYCLLNDGELERADSHLREAERLLAAAHAERVVINEAAFHHFPVAIAIARAYLAQSSGNVTAAVENAQRALKLVSAENHYDRGLAHFFLGLAHWSSGDLEAAAQSIGTAVSCMRHIGNFFFQVVGTAILANIKAVQGHLREAAVTYERALQFTMGQGGFALRETAEPHIGLSGLHREWDDLETAVKQLQQGKEELADQSAFLGSASRWWVAMARIKDAEGDSAGALELLQEAERHYKRDPYPDVRPVAAVRARVWLAQGRLADALGWVREQGLSADDGLSYLREFDHITLAKILIAQYRQDREERYIQEAMSLLARLLEAAETGGRTTSALEILIQQALAHEARGHTAAALEPLAHALALAAPQGCVRIFVDEGQPMRQLLAASLAQGAAPDYVTRLMQAIDPAPDTTSAPPDPNQLLIEPLSDRELEVLALIGNGLTNQAIADELVIALSTVKKHVNNILGKLHVGNRTEATARARELNIL